MRCKLSVLIPAYNTGELTLKALDSIPALPGIETIIIDDGSTDDTLDLIKIYQRANPQKDIKVSANITNKGVGYTRNRLLNLAEGEYILWLDSDDYLLPGTLHQFFPMLANGTDLVYFDIITADGKIFPLRANTRECYCGTTKFIRRAFIGDTRYPEIRVEEDKHFFRDLLKKNPTEHYTNRLLIYYNWPRVGSLCYKKERGELSCQ